MAQSASLPAVFVSGLIDPLAAFHLPALGGLGCYLIYRSATSFNYVAYLLIRRLTGHVAGTRINGDADIPPLFGKIVLYRAGSGAGDLANCFQQ